MCLFLQGGLLREMYVYDGTSLYPLSVSDMEGCLLSADAAWELFGDTTVEGTPVTYRDKSYTIRGILREPGKLFVYECGAAEKKGRRKAFGREKTFGNIFPESTAAVHGLGIPVSCGFDR